ncbi:MAG: type II toxin-antitoxin system VapC family toxin [Tannerella sp.]|nr:type II toxin-antitoxin system VapC family toxin [Tannerella sp.]
MILCDTNILIEIYRENVDIISILKNISQSDSIVISDVTKAEMLVGARNKHEMKTLIEELGRITSLPIQSQISSFAIKLLSHYYLSHGLDFHDALIAATAISYNIELYTLNVKDFAFISNIKLYNPDKS